MTLAVVRWFLLAAPTALLACGEADAPASDSDGATSSAPSASDDVGTDSDVHPMGSTAASSGGGQMDVPGGGTGSNSSSPSSGDENVTEQPTTGSTSPPASTGSNAGPGANVADSSPTPTGSDGSQDNNGDPADDGAELATDDEQLPDPDQQLADTDDTTDDSSANEMVADDAPPDDSSQGDDSDPDDAAPDPDDAASDDTASPDPDPSNCSAPASTTTVIGYGAETTGGGNASPVVVRSFSEAEAALDDYRSAFKDGAASALVLRYEGSFDYSSITDVCRQHTLDSQILQIKEMENVTFEGAPGSSANFGIKINRAKNVIVRNMTLGLLPGGGDSDAITIEGNGENGDVEHVWIDHNELFSSTKDDCDGAGDTEFDGLIDIKKGARYITISYNHLHDHQKTGLIGHSDSDDMDRYVTFHHNWYENVVSRTPLHRFGYVHLFNNYYSDISSSGINVRMGGVALIEANYFENVVNPITSRYSDEAGYWDLRDNHIGQGVTWSTESDTLANADDWQSTATFPSGELNYSYSPDDAGCVKQIVMSNAGATL